MKKNKVNWWKTVLKEEQANAAANSVKEKHLSNGPVTKLFEIEFAKMMDVKYAVATPSGTLAIVLALIANGIKSGDEVIVPCSTWIATAHAAMLLGCKIVFVDVEESKLIIDCSKIEEKITKRTKAIIPVHLNGRCVNLNDLEHIAKKYQLIIIEDACQALLSKNEQGYLGTLSTTGCFSLGMTKLLPTGQGGMVVTNKKDIYNRLLLAKNNGMEDIISPQYQIFGANFKYSDVLAAIGLSQLDLLKDRIKKLLNIYFIYKNVINNLSTIKLIPIDIDKGELPLYVDLMVEDRSSLMSFLLKNDIMSRILPPSLNSAPQFNDNSSYPNSKLFGEMGMYLPSGPDQSINDIERVCTVIQDYETEEVFMDIRD